MAPRQIDPAELDAEIARLPGLGIEELRAHWKELFGRPAPRSFRRNLLIRGVACQMPFINAASIRRLWLVRISSRLLHLTEHDLVCAPNKHIEATTFDTGIIFECFEQFEFTVRDTDAAFQ